MPIYEYRCDKCGHEFEREQRISDDPVKTCPACRARRVKRLISQTSFVLKGSGWYSDLYSSAKGGKQETSDASSESSASDSKSAPKKDGDSSGESKSGGKSSKKSGPGKKSAA